jgi:ribosome assembly protein YihI (activator of Der GTPase)
MPHDKYALIPKSETDITLVRDKVYDVIQQNARTNKENLKRRGKGGTPYTMACGTANQQNALPTKDEVIGRSRI